MNILHNKKNYIPDFIDIASTCNSVMEIGCGTGNIIQRIKAATRIGLDAFRPVMDSMQEGVVNIQYDLNLGISNLFLDNTLDCIIGIDVIEHLHKSAAFELLKDCESIARKYLMFFVPVGEHPQVKDDRGFGNDYYQTHRSSWSPKEMEVLGYDVCFIENYHNQPNKDTGAMFCLKMLSSGLRKINW